MAAVGMYVVEYYPIHLPWYGLLLALGIGATLFIPIGIVMAITNQQSSIYLICQLICGGVFPGRPVANMVFTTFGYISSTQGLKFASDLKLGHYMKIPPRLLFRLQLSVTVVSSLTQIGVLNWMLNYIPGICTTALAGGALTVTGLPQSDMVITMPPAPPPATAPRSNSMRRIRSWSSIHMS